MCIQRLKAIGNYIKLRPIDVVVYMDRFDLCRTDGNDRQVCNDSFNAYLLVRSPFTSCVESADNASPSKNKEVFVFMQLNVPACQRQVSPFTFR